MQLKFILSVACKQINDIFIIEFEHGNMHHEIDAWSSFNSLVDMFECSGNNSSFFLDFFISFHGMRFACSCLPVGKDCSIISLKDTFNNGKSGLLKNILLKTFRLKDHVKTKYSLLLSYIFHIGDYDFTSLLIYMDNLFVTSFDFIARHGSAPDCHFHTFIL